MVRFPPSGPPEEFKEGNYYRYPIWYVTVSTVFGASGSGSVIISTDPDPSNNKQLYQYLIIKLLLYFPPAPLVSKKKAR